MRIFIKRFEKVSVTTDGRSGISLVEMPCHGGLGCDVRAKSLILIDPD
jgi:hypothetical protein